MTAIIAGLAGAFVVLGLGLIAWSMAPRRIDGWTACDFGPLAKAVALILTACAAFLLAAAGFVEPALRAPAGGIAAAAGVLGLALGWNAFFYRCVWDVDALTVSGALVGPRRIDWADVKHGGAIPLIGCYWVSDARGRRIWWCAAMRGWEPLERAVERRLGPRAPISAARAKRGDAAPQSTGR